MCSLLILNSKTLIALISRFRHFLNLIISLDFKLDLGEIKMSDIVELFRSYSNKKISENLLRELKSFKNNWIKKRESHINFLGGNLLGPDEIIFSDADRITYFDIIGIYEPKELAVDILKLKDIKDLKIKAESEGKKGERKVSFDEFNLSIIWLCHEFSLLYKDNIKKYHEAVDLIYFIYAVKVFGSRYILFFSKYSLDVDTAKIAYEKLSGKFLIKKYDNWDKVIQHLGKKLYSTDDSGFDSRVRNMNTLDSLYIAQDLHGSITSIFKNIYAEIDLVKKAGEKLRTTSSVDTTGDEDQIRDILDSPVSYVEYMKNIVVSQASFVDFAVVDIITAIYPKINDKIFKQTLTAISMYALEDKNINEYFIEMPILLSIEYLGSSSGNNYTSNIESVVVALKNYWSSSSVKQKDVNTTKDNIRKFLEKNTTYTSKHIVSNMVLAIIMYIFIKAVRRDKL